MVNFCEYRVPESRSNNSVMKFIVIEIQRANIKRVNSPDSYIDSTTELNSRNLSGGYLLECLVFTYLRSPVMTLL